MCFLIELRPVTKCRHVFTDRRDRLTRLSSTPHGPTKGVSSPSKRASAPLRWDTRLGRLPADCCTFEPWFDPAKAGAGSGFTEGNAWQYSWYQPQDEQGLIDLLGG